MYYPEMKLFLTVWLAPTVYIHTISTRKLPVFWFINIGHFIIANDGSIETD